jgi:hypothetical protein
MRKTAFRTLLAALLFFPVTIVRAQLPPDSTRHERKTETVYITRRGTKYHLAECRFLSKSKIAVPLAEAKKYYQPCKVCKPGGMRRE